MAEAKAGRRALLGLMLLSTALHGYGMSREPLPAQDGLKFLRVARDFQDRHWVDVVRDSDQHPLYPALVALAEPAVAAGIGPGPDAWRIAAQLVSALAAVALLVPLHGLARSLFDERTANLTGFLWLLLPLPSEIGHETLADSLGLLLFATSLRLGEHALRAGSLRSALGCGLVSGLWYLARPEAVVVPAAVALVAMSRWRLPAPDHAGLVRLAGLAVAFVALVGGYTLAKGTVSEKLSLRIGAGMTAAHVPERKAPPPVPKGLDDARWDFSPKEESESELRGRPWRAAGLLGFHWAEALGFILVPFLGIGLWFGSAREGKLLVATYVILFALLACRHATVLGYLSGRHALTITLAVLPWAASGYVVLSRGLAARRGWDESATPRRRAIVAALALAVGVWVQANKPGHPGRWGHLAAGTWLSRHAGPDDAVLDTRGWARFVSDRPGYDYWHVRQALTDPRLAYVVVGNDELEAGSRRGETLRAVLAFAGEPVAAFPSRKRGRDVAVRVFRFNRPSSWEPIAGLDAPAGGRRL